ncbi:MAG: tRNA (adenosine(37)-N6)-threonylcarbamoyltransferase complex transferase subunit TsaD [Rickettsiaceae bacterium]
MNKKDQYILGIESSCDDTAVAVLDKDCNILSNIVLSQHNCHKIFKGIVPELAARAHIDNINAVTKKALNQAKVSIEDINIIAATSGPGLIGGLIVGLIFAKTLASVLQKPFIAVNHLEGHALTAKLTNGIQYPYLLLLISGGHCQFVIIQELGKYKVIGQTLDDALGEAFDKVAKMLDLDFPGGPEIEKYAKNGDENKYILPKPMKDSGDCNMSFSGLKTAIMLLIKEKGSLSLQDKYDIAASFQKTVAEILIIKIRFAISVYQITNSNRSYKKNIVVSGGVASNSYLRGIIAKNLAEIDYNLVCPPSNLCTDNAAMIAYTGLQRFNAGIRTNLDFAPKARWSLDSISANNLSC